MFDSEAREAGVADYVNHAFSVYSFVSQQQDLSPRNPALNGVLSAFVHETMRERAPADVAAILSHPIIQEIAPELRRHLGRAEFEMECYCAAAMAGNIPGAASHYSDYSGFIYRGNYEALVESELRAMKWHIKQPPLKPESESVAFVGAGPLPISAIMFSQRTGLPVTCIDIDPEACRLGANLIRHLAATDPLCRDIDKRIHYVCSSGDAHDYATHPIVFIASLVDQKDKVLQRIVRTSHTVAMTVVRTAEGLSTLLYQPEDCIAGQEEYNMYLTGQSKRTADAINTSLVYKFPPGKWFARNKIEFIGATDDVTALRPMGRRRIRTLDARVI
ncbi:MAG: nicotianamine synthase family protein [Alphaproteobacteria bacterium]